MARQPVNLLPTDLAGSMQVNTTIQPRPTASWQTASGSPVLHVEIPTAPPKNAAVGLHWPSTQPGKRGDVMLARFFARTDYARQESGEAMLEFEVKQNRPAYSAHVKSALSAGPDWTLLEIPFVLSADFTADQLEIDLFVTSISQAVDFAGFELLNFGNRATIAELPQTRFTYKGREPDAAWREAALKRIEEIRTAPLAIRVIDAKGKPIDNAAVAIRLKQPAFLFGTEVDAPFLLNNSADGQKYRETLLSLFDSVVIGNGLKWPGWSSSAEARAEALRAADWIRAQNLRQRGHNLVWPADKFSPRRIAGMPAPRAELPLLIKEHIRDLMTATKGRIVAWDVINEMLHERDYFKYMPETEAAEWFKLARQLDPQAKLFINEYGMLNSRKSPDTIANYVALVGRLRAAGAPIDGMGIQGHVGRQMRNPTDVLADLDLLAAPGLELQITEFDINTLDEELQADYTRDFLIALYSHPAVTGFTMWGFWQAKHWKPNAAMFRTDWSEKPNAKVWRELVRNQWLTAIDTTTNSEGQCTARGHLGEYEFTVTTDKKVTREMRTLTKEGTTLTIQVP